MLKTRFRRPRLIAAIACGLLPISATAQAGVIFPIVDPDDIEWTLYSSQPGDCNSPPPDSLSVDCGTYGTFYFGPPLPQLDCTDLASGTESAPGGYNLHSFEVLAKRQYTDAVFTILPILKAAANIGSGTGSGIGSGNGELNQPLEAPLKPCANGSCLSPPGGGDGQQRWLMVLDWKNGPQADHGLMMAAIGSQVWQGAVHLAGVDSTETISVLGEGISDGHLIHQLCQIVDSVDDGILRAPEGLSMSLGRYDEGTSSSSSCTATSSELTCQLQQVIQQLADAGTLVFAAAGNYQKLEIPATLPNVTDIGNLDMPAFQHFGAIQPSWESPAESTLVFPGSGICVEYENAGERLLYPTPGGTSYANIIAASMISRAAVTYQLPEPLAYSWKPSWQQPTNEHGEGNGEGCFVYGNFGYPYCNQAVSRMMKRILGFPITTCWSVEISNAVLEIDMPAGAPLVGVTDDAPGLSQCLANHQPAPTNDLCIPCGMGQSKAKAQQLWRSKAIGRPIDERRDAVLDISATTPLNPPGTSVTLEITELFLRVGEDFYPLLSRSDPGQAFQLSQMAKAKFETLVVYGAIPFVPAGSQPSLVAFYQETASAGSIQTDCWHSSPLNMMGAGDANSLYP